MTRRAPLKLSAHTDDRTRVCKEEWKENLLLTVVALGMVREVPERSRTELDSSVRVIQGSSQVFEKDETKRNAGCGTYQKSEIERDTSYSLAAHSLRNEELETYENSSKGTYRIVFDRTSHPKKQPSVRQCWKRNYLALATRTLPLETEKTPAPPMLTMAFYESDQRGYTGDFQPYEAVKANNIFPTRTNISVRVLAARISKA
ncbi:hypothetical protein BJ508DRAFT_314074 [Ascobolus immersus RN42]|uniref:Uncharacterized protein n=1 Tax=Ascobolus immersus RN42 TaxID=1160509 RepID=A0A3N4HGE2_ASCIM|nr:hypothetical protein BJ508DRAFT_314074 [Ascobolus immersus RN42]